MLTIYPAVFFKETNGYSVIFPDLNYIATCGDTLDEAMEMTIDCLAGYIHTAKIEKESIPIPSDIKGIDPIAVARYLEFEPGEHFVNMIAVNIDEYAKPHFERPVKKTLTIPAWLNDTAQNKGINFSAVLQEALKERLGISQ